MNSAEWTQKCQRVAIDTPAAILLPVQPFPSVQRVVEQNSGSSNDDIMVKLNIMMTSMASKQDLDTIETNMSNLNISVDEKFKSIETRLDGSDATITKLEELVTKGVGGEPNCQWGIEIESMKKKCFVENREVSNEQHGTNGKHNGDWRTS